MNDAQILRLLMAHGAKLTRNRQGKTPLTFAVPRGCSRDVLTALLEYGAAVNAVDESGSTPLYQAAHIGDTETVRLLIKRGTNVNGQTANGFTPLVAALRPVYDIDDEDVVGERVWRTQTIETLLECGADIHLMDKHGQTPLFIAVGVGDLAAIRILLANGANIEARDKRGETPLFATMRDCPFTWGWKNDPARTKVLSVLLEAGADVNALSNDDKTVLDLCINTDARKLLLKHGAKTGAELKAGAAGKQAD